MGRSQKAVSLALLLALSGCGTAPVLEVDENREALKNVRDSWLVECTGVGSEARPGDATGDLLEDFSNAAKFGGICQERHRSLVEYLRPLVERARSQ